MEVYCIYSSFNFNDIYKHLITHYTWLYNIKNAKEKISAIKNLMKHLEMIYISIYYFVFVQYLQSFILCNLFLRFSQSFLQFASHIIHSFCSYFIHIDFSLTLALFSEYNQCYCFKLVTMPYTRFYSFKYFHLFPF